MARRAVAAQAVHCDGSHRRFDSSGDAAWAPKARKLPHKCTRAAQTCGISAPASGRTGVFLHRGRLNWGYFCTAQAARRWPIPRCSGGFFVAREAYTVPDLSSRF